MILSLLNFITIKHFPVTVEQQIPNKGPSMYIYIVYNSDKFSMRKVDILNSQQSLFV